MNFKKKAWKLASLAIGTMLMGSTEGMDVILGSVPVVEKDGVIPPYDAFLPELF